MCAVALGACGDGANPDATPDAGLPAGPVDMFAATDPFIGTGGLGFGVGSTYPGPGAPFGMIHPGPDTRAPFGAPGPQHCSGYWYEDPQIAGFSLTRMNGTGVPDYGTIGIMPVDGMTAARVDEPGYAALFDHADEAAEPGYYDVTLADGIRVEITALERSAMFGFEFPAGVEPTVLMDLGHVIGQATTRDGAIVIDPATGNVTAKVRMLGDLSDRVGGFDIFAVGQFSPAPTAVGVWTDAGLDAGTATATGDDIGGWLQWAPGTERVELRVAISFVDEAGAAANLAAEIPAFDFAGVRAAIASTWRDELGAVTLEGASARDATLVASAMYRTLLMPTLISDVDGRVRDVHGDITATPTRRYSDLSLWDTYRTQHPWLLLREDARNPDFAASFMAIADEGGAFPQWQLAHGDIHSMIGSPGEIVMAEMAAKGIDFDQNAALDAAMITARGPAPGVTGGRGAASLYVQYGYVPSDMQDGSVSKTLEYAIADHALAEWARRLGRDEDAALLAAQADSWRSLYNPDVGFMVPRTSSGDWDTWSDPEREYDAYVEGNAWQYLWLVPQDMLGLAEVMGGKDAALAVLTGLFERSEAETVSLGPQVYYWHGNEPDLHAAWMFAALGQPGEAVRWIDWILRERHTDGPDGLPGNDDGGTLSAWIMFAAAGIYPIAGTDRYVVAAPRQTRMVLHRPGGDLTIEAAPDPRTHPVPVRVTLDGVEVDGPELRHADLAGARVLRFEMATE